MSMSFSITRYVDEETMHEYIVEFIKEGIIAKVEENEMNYPIQGSFTISTKTGKIKLSITKLS